MPPKKFIRRQSAVKSSNSNSKSFFSRTWVRVTLVILLLVGVILTILFVIALHSGHEIFGKAEDNSTNKNNINR